MDPVTIGAVLLAIITEASQALRGQLWAGLVSLVRRPLRHRGSSNEVAVASGEAELAALQRAPTDQQKAAALAERLLARAADDAEFGQALQEWWERAEPVRAQLRVTVTNTISGGTQHGPVLQGRNFRDVRIETMVQAAAAPPALAQLPPLETAFTGRDRELAEVTALLCPAGEAGPAVASGGDRRFLIPRWVIGPSR